jgi:flotillin
MPTSRALDLMRTEKEESVNAKNEYLEQVLAEKAQIEDDLKVRRAPQDLPAMAMAAPRAARAPGFGGAPQPSPAVAARITGWWRWKNVIVPPNAYVVHTRRGRSDPLHIGLGLSFRFDPVRDSFLVVPATLQTILIHARCICSERQGLVVQGYVQWIVDDFATAYKKLDFSDAIDPMRVVNVQLREQAEAAIKDKVSTMSIDDVLADKQPIIQELTARLRQVAEGDGASAGLGLRIVTVQIKEAIVSSAEVWEMLQRPFRSERKKAARLAELESESVVRARESEVQKEATRLSIEAESERARLRTEADAEIARQKREAEVVAFEEEQAAIVRRAEREAATRAATNALERSKIDEEALLARLRIEHELEIEELRRQAERLKEEQRIALLAAERRVENDLSKEMVRLRLVEQLPAIAAGLPKPSELRSVTIGGDGLTGFITNLVHAIEGRSDKDAA